MALRGMVVPLILGVILLALVTLVVRGFPRAAPQPVPTPEVRVDPRTSLAANQYHYYFAEGRSEPPFRTWFSIYNPDSDITRVTIVLYAEDGTMVRQNVDVGALQQARISAAELLPNAVFGAEIYSTKKVYVERFTAGHRDGTAAPGVELATDWYFPDAMSGGDSETRLAILNPGTGRASVTVTLIPLGGLSAEHTFGVEAAAQRAITVSQYMPPGPLAMIVHSDRPVAAEHVTFLDEGQAMYGAVGFPQGRLSKRWYVALANTQPGFAARLALLNTEDKPANVKLTVIVDRTRKTIPVAPLLARSKRDLDLGAIAGAEHASLEIIADRLIAAQTVTTYVSNTGDGAVAAYSLPAQAVTARQWSLPDTRADDDYDSYVTIFNPNSGNAVVTVTYLRDGAPPLSKRYTVGGLGRLTASVRDDAGAAQPPADVSAVVVKSDWPVVAERVTLFRRSVGASASVGIAGP